MRKSALIPLCILILFSFSLNACKEGSNLEVTQEAQIDCMNAEPGDEINLLHQWSDAEEEKLMEVLSPLIDVCGITILPESSQDQVSLGTRVEAGTPPDVAFGGADSLAQYEDLLLPVTDLGVNPDNYADYWKDNGTVNSKLLGIPVQVDLKTLIWYSPENFDAAGYTVPTTWDELNALVEQMVANGEVPWSMSMAAGETADLMGTDFIQDILLVKQGPEYVLGIIDGSVPYNDPGVKEAYEIFGKWAMDESYTVGGAAGILSTGCEDALLKVFSSPHEAMLVKQSGFADSTIAASLTGLEYGSGYDFFAVPEAQGYQFSSTWLMAFSDESAVQALVAYLSSETGGEKWAEVGFGLTPNLAGSESYTDPILIKKDEVLSGAAILTPAIRDSIPGGFGNAEYSGIMEYLNGGNLDAILDILALLQQEARE